MCFNYGIIQYIIVSVNNGNLVMAIHLYSNQYSHNILVMITACKIIVIHAGSLLKNHQFIDQQHNYIIII